MTVAELIEKLKTLDPAFPVVYNGREDVYWQVERCEVEEADEWTKAVKPGKKFVVVS